MTWPLDSEDTHKHQAVAGFVGFVSQGRMLTEDLDCLDFTCEAAAEESPDEDADQSHVFDEEGFCGFCCHEGQLSVIQSSTLRTINSPRALEHGAADAKWLYGNAVTDSNRDWDYSHHAADH